MLREREKLPGQRRLMQAAHLRPPNGTLKRTCTLQLSRERFLEELFARCTVPEAPVASAHIIVRGGVAERRAPQSRRRSACAPATPIWWSYSYSLQQAHIADRFIGVPPPNKPLQSSRPGFGPPPTPPPRVPSVA